MGVSGDTRHVNQDFNFLPAVMRSSVLLSFHFISLILFIIVMIIVMIIIIIIIVMAKHDDDDDGSIA